MMTAVYWYQELYETAVVIEMRAKRAEEMRNLLAAVRLYRVAAQLSFEAAEHTPRGNNIAALVRFRTFRNQMEESARRVQRAIEEGGAE